MSVIILNYFGVVQFVGIYMRKLIEPDTMLKRNQGLSSLRSKWLSTKFKIALLGTAATLVFSVVFGQNSSAISGTNQPSGAPSTTPTPQKYNAGTADERYRIGPGDVLDIKVFNKPQFNREGVKVDPRGMIRMPLVKEEITAACSTEDELAARVTIELKEYIRDPEVIVQIKEYQSEPVAVLGSVRAPSRFQLQRRVRLLELLTFVNGTTENAGRTIQVVHTGLPGLCESPSDVDKNRSEAAFSQIENYKLSETLRGEEKANPFVRPGDVVSIPEADQVFVIGNVVRPTSIALKESMTVSRAIAIAGGTAIDTKKNQIHIIRQTPDMAEKTEIIVDLDAISRHKAVDTILVANDIIDVPASGGRRILRSLVGAVVPSVGQLPVRVIP